MHTSRVSKVHPDSDAILHASRLMRWMIIATVVITFPAAPSSLPIMAALVLTVTAYSLIFYTPWFLRFLAGRVLFRLIFLDSLLVGMFVALPGGLQNA